MARTRRTPSGPARTKPLRRAPLRTAFGRASGPVAHAAWLVALAGQVAGAATYDRSDDLGPAMSVFIVTGLLAGAVTAAVAQADTATTDRKGRRGGRRQPRGSRPWRAPAVYGYLAAWVVLTPIASPAGFAVGAVMIVVTGLGGVALYLVVVLEAMCLAGLRGFGSILVGRAPPGDRSRWIALGPFVATAGVSLWFLPIVGCLGYDSPHRRDLGPLVGVVRDGVEVTHPVLLLIGQIGTGLVLGLIAAGTLILAVARRRA